MRKMICLAGIVLALLTVQPGFAQNKDVKQVANKQTSQLKTMAWTTSSTAAKKLTAEGSDYLMNVEYPQAYEKFAEALQLDPNFTVALVFMTDLSVGNIKKEYAKRALKSAENKTDGEKLFASLAKEDGTTESRRQVWEKLHTMFPDGGMIGYFYVATRATPEERMQAAQDYITKFPDNACMYNTIAYYYMLDKKDMAKAKENFDKYMKLYPDSYNAYDSMGEYYLTLGDKENARKYYTMSLERYPFAKSSVDAMQKMDDDAKKQAADKQ